MHLTKKEIVQTQIIVTTPEKWDIITRKSTGEQFMTYEGVFGKTSDPLQ